MAILLKCQTSDKSIVKLVKHMVFFLFLLLKITGIMSKPIKSRCRQLLFTMITKYKDIICEADKLYKEKMERLDKIIAIGGK